MDSPRESKGDEIERSQRMLDFEASGKLEGHLYKEGNNMVKDWRKRWFELRSNLLSYYKKEGDITPLGSIEVMSGNCILANVLTFEVVLLGGVV